MSIAKEGHSPTIETIVAGLNLVESNNRNHIKGKNAILVIGNTGAGKSTFINYVVGRPFSKEKSALGVDCYNCGDYIMKIGTNLLQSETVDIQCYYDENTQLTYCDCPGFMDSRGVDVDIINAYALQQISKECASIKGVVVIINFHAIVADRGRSVTDLAHTLTGILGDQLILGDFCDSLLILVSRVPEDVSVSDIQAHLAATDQLPFGSMILSKVNIYDVCDAHMNGAKRHEIGKMLQSLTAFPSASLRFAISAASEVVIDGLLGEEIRHVCDAIKGRVSIYAPSSSALEAHYRSVNKRIINMQKLASVGPSSAKERINSFMIDAQCIVSALSSSDNNLSKAEAIKVSIPILADAAAQTVASIKASVQAKEDFERRERRARELREREQEEAARRRRELERAEEERRRIEREREALERQQREERERRERERREREEEERRRRESRRHPGSLVLTHQPVMTGYGLMMAVVPVWTCCGSTDQNHPGCVQGGRDNAMYFTL